MLSLLSVHARIRIPSTFRWKPCWIHQTLQSHCSEETDTNGSNGSDLHRVIRWILKHDPTKIVILAGAGISTASGIPDFRSPGSGLYDNLKKYHLPYPEAVFDIEYFYSNPVPFYTIAKQLYPTGHYRPNLAHYFMRLLHEKQRLLRVYTQNIDSLERMAGIPKTKLVEAHGTFLTATCIVCQAKAPPELVKDAIYRSIVPKCPKCGDVVKPDIIFFGEQLPKQFWSYPQDLARADMVLIMGTSLEVYPFAGVADRVAPSVPRVLFNRDPVGSFRRRHRPKDFVILGSISASVKKLTKALDWYDDLVRLMEQCESNPSDDNGGSKGQGKVTNRRAFSTCSRASKHHSDGRFHSLPPTADPCHMKYHERKKHRAPLPTTNMSTPIAQSMGICDYIYPSWSNESGRTHSDGETDLSSQG